MERLLGYIVFCWILLVSVRIFIFWSMEKLLKSKKPDKKTKLMSSRAEATSKLFNQLLKTKKLNYNDINSISKILKSYAGNKKYNTNIHLIYSVLKHSAIRNQDLTNIQFLLDCARCRKAK